MTIQLDFTRSALSVDTIAKAAQCLVRVLKSSNLDLSGLQRIEVVADIGARNWELTAEVHEENSQGGVLAFVHVLGLGGETVLVLWDQVAAELAEGSGLWVLQHELVHVEQERQIVPMFGLGERKLEEQAALRYWMEYDAQRRGLSSMSDLDAPKELNRWLLGSTRIMSRHDCVPLSEKEQTDLEHSYPIESATQLFVYAWGVLDSRSPKVGGEWERGFWAWVGSHLPGWEPYLRETVEQLRKVGPVSPLMFNGFQAHLKRCLYPDPVQG
jgi:hypothetical protein